VRIRENLGVAFYLLMVGMDKLYCGIDIHKETFVGCIMDMNGTVLREHEFPANLEVYRSPQCP